MTTQFEADAAETQQCPDCSGDGEIESPEEKTVECPRCGGTGGYAPSK